MATTDVIARLRLNAEQFSSEMGKAFASAAANGERAAPTIVKPFAAAVAEVQKLAQTSIQLPRTTGGGLDLSREIADLKQSAAQAEQHAIALRELAAAQLTVARNGHAGAEALRVEADAASVAAAAADDAAQADRRRAAAIEEVQNELNRTTSATMRGIGASKEFTNSAGAVRSAMQGVTYQMQDAFTQISMGANAFQVLAIQGGQLAGQFAMLEGRAGSVARFFTGPWGLAITAGMMVLGPFVSKLWEAGDAAKGAEEAAASLARRMEDVSTFFDRATGKVREYNQALIQKAVVLAQERRQTAVDAQNAARREAASAYEASLRASAASSGMGWRFRQPNTDIQAIFASGRNIDQQLATLARSTAGNAALARTILDKRAEIADRLQAIAKEDAFVKSLETGVLSNSLRTGGAAGTGGGSGRGGGARAGGGGRAGASDTRELAKATRDLEAALSGLQGKFDPITAELETATEAYRKAIADIDALVGAGKLDEITERRFRLSASDRLDDARAKARLDRGRTIFGDPEAELFDATKGAVDSWLKGIVDGARRGGDELQRGVRTAADELRYAAGGIADLFGVRINGPLRNMLQPGGIGGQAQDITDAVRLGLAGMNVNLSPKAETMLKEALTGAGYGQIGGSIFASITGGRNNALASSIGGVLGMEAGKALGGSIGNLASGVLGKGLGGAIGSAAGPLGSILGGVLGSLVGGLFSSPKYGTSAVAAPGQKATGAGNSAAARAGATSLSGAVQQGIQQIADALGAQIGNYNVSIGTFDGKYRVSTTGFTGSLDSKKAKGQGLMDFGVNGQDEAIAYAISDALLDGAIRGISAASQRILSGATQEGLQKALNKAMLIEGIPKQLKAYLDPVGAAIDELNRKFRETVDALTQGGASAEQFAQAQELYNLQLGEVKANTASASASLKDFLKSMQIGSSSPLSLRDQDVAARAALQPFLDTINAGGRVDQAKYQESAAAALDIQRQIFGSSRQFFEFFDQIQAATAKAIDTIDNAVPITPGVENPFAEATAKSTQATAELLEQQNDLLRAQNTMFASLFGNGGLGYDFLSDQRAFY